MYAREGTGTIMAAQLAPDRFLVSVGGTLDAEAGAALRDMLLPLAGADSARILLDLGDAALEAYDPAPTLVDAGAVAASTGGRLTVVTSDRRLRTALESDGRVEVEARLEERLL